MSNQSYLKCEHNPLDEEDFDLHPDWKSGHVYNEEDEDGDIVEDEEDDCDIEDDDYCSDESSTTSTSSTNNQPDNTRVCDCCYCEVFGNGAAPVAPTSRNYNEMRERLRLRLSKRRAERCERSMQQNGNVSKDDSANDRGGGPQMNTNGANGSHQGNKSNTPVVDQRNLDELLNYINGKGGQKDQEKSASKKKDKNKNNNNNKKSNNKNNSHTKSTHKEDKDLDKCNNQSNGTSNPSNNNNNNHHHHHNHHYHPNSSGGDATTSGGKRQQANNSGIHHNSHSCAAQQQNQLENHHNNHRTSTNGNNRTTPEAVNNGNNNKLIGSDQPHDENYQPPQTTPTSSGKQKRKEREKSTNSKDQLSNKIQQNLSAKTISSSNGGSSRETCEPNLGTNHTASINANKQANTSNNQIFSTNVATNVESNNLSDHQNIVHLQTTKNEPDGSYLSPLEDVFMPRDIDLNDDQLDELERELEAFKRFCFDSVPLVKKERVRVQLKDSNFFQELTERITNGSTISNQQHAGTSRPLQTQMFRRKVSRI